LAEVLLGHGKPVYQGMLPFPVQSVVE
jgi:hypothetical protein